MTVSRRHGDCHTLSLCLLPVAKCAPAKSLIHGGNSPISLWTTPSELAHVILKSVRRLGIVFAVLVILVLVLVGLLAALSATPTVQLPPSLTALGSVTPVTVHVTDSHGIRKIEAWVEQNGARYDVYRKALPATRILWSRHAAPSSWDFTAGLKTTPQLKDGPARLVVEVTSNDFRGATARLAGMSWW